MINKLSQAFTGNSLLHGLYIAILGAVSGVAYPLIQAWAAGNPVPDIRTIVMSVLKVSIGAAALYISKNGIFGGSSTPATATTQSVTNKNQ